MLCPLRYYPNFLRSSGLFPRKFFRWEGSWPLASRFSLLSCQVKEVCLSKILPLVGFILQCFQKMNPNIYLLFLCQLIYCLSSNPLPIWYFREWRIYPLCNPEALDSSVMLSFISNTQSFINLSIFSYFSGSPVPITISVIQADTFHFLDNRNF